jgi:superfamily I DNA/RNA helicase
MLIGELVPEALRYLRNNPAASELTEFTQVLVDEYQDLNAAEQEVVSLLATTANLTIIGDEDQSIYSFKYAHPEGIEEFHQRNGGTADETLDLCRRCPTAIVEMANEIIRQNRRRTNRALLPHHQNGQGEVRIVQWPSIQAEAEGLARFIQQRVATEQVQPGRVLVLAPRRAFGYAVRDALNAIGIPAHSFFQEEALEGDPKDLADSRKQQAFSLLTLAADPTDAVALRCWCGFGNQTLRTTAWARVRALCDQVGRPLVDVLGDIRDGHVNLPHGGSLRSRLVELQQALQALNALRGQALLDALFPAADADFQQFRDLVAELSDDADAAAILSTLRTSITQPELPTDVDYVRVMSLHKSKGLTADLVVVMGCVEGLTPHIDESLGQAEQNAALEEQRRLFYVAITRSRDTLILSSVTSLPRSLAHRLQVRVTGRGQTVSTITSRFIDELGPTRPNPIRGERLLQMGNDE